MELGKVVDVIETAPPALEVPEDLVAGDDEAVLVDGERPSTITAD